MDVARLKAVIEADSEKGEAGLKRFHGLIGQSASAMGGLATGLGALAGATVIGGIALIVSQLGGMVKSGEDANTVTAQTEAVLKSTHGAAGMTAQAIDALSTKYMNLTGIDDDVVKSTENMLLTFTNIGKDVFPQATKTALDMSVALGQDVKNSSIQLGKALNDPIAGISALSRVGVTFDQKQKDLIATYMKHGDIAKAQGVILQELQKEFGGSAEAAGQANGGIKILTAQFDNVKQTVGQAVIPILQKLMTAVTPLIQQFGAWLPGALATAQTFIDKNVMPTVLKLGNWFLKDGAPALKSFAGFIMNNVVPAIQNMWQWAQKYIVPILITLGNVVLNNVLPALKDIWGHISQSLIPALQRLWEKISPVLIPVFQTLGWVLQNVVGPALGIVIDVISHLIDLIATIIGKIGDFLGLLGQVKDAIGSGVGNFFANFPHFASGGTTPGGQFVGAEEGPELLLTPGVYTAPAGSRVVNARDTRRMLANGGDGGNGGGNGTTITYNIYPAKEHFGPSELDTLTRRHALLANTGGGY